MEKKVLVSKEPTQEMKLLIAEYIGENGDSYDDETKNLLFKEILGFIKQLQPKHPTDEEVEKMAILDSLKKWIVEQRNMAHVNCLEERKQAYNNVLAHMESALQSQLSQPKNKEQTVVPNSGLRCDDWVIGDKFTCPEINEVFTVTAVMKYDVVASDKRSAAGYTIFSKDYVTKTEWLDESASQLSDPVLEMEVYVHCRYNEADHILTLPENEFQFVRKQKIKDLITQSKKQC